jgi:N-acetylglucosaminyldiphosphoundecaprenol N-acetyl-beta-D-mannosaminyltransferase
MSDSVHSNSIDVLGVRVGRTGADALLECAKMSARARRGEAILPLNAHFLNLAYENRWLREYVNRDVDYAVADGKGVLLGARLLGKTPPEQIRFADWVWRLFLMAVEQKFTVFFLGANQATLEAAVRRVRGEFPELRLVGFHHGYVENDMAENRIVLEQISGLSPDILLLGMSMPVEERWLMTNKASLRCGVYVFGAGCFEWLGGKIGVPPRWASAFYGEWLYRLFHEPKRLWRRYLLGNPLFLLRVVNQAWRAR